VSTICTKGVRTLVYECATKRSLSRLSNFLIKA